MAEDQDHHQESGKDRTMTQTELDQINAKRRAAGLRPLTMSEARSALATRSNSTGPIERDTSADFLLGYMGVPMPSGAGMAGYAAHIATTPDFSPSSDHSSPSCDTGSSYDSGSSFDGGGSCGGGSD
jgi:hypothetical protein